MRIVEARRLPAGRCTRSARGFLKDNHEVRLAGIRDAQGNDLETDVANGVVGFDLDVFPANRNIVFLGARDGIAQFEQQSFAGHLQNAESGAARGNLQIAIHVAAGVDDLEGFIDENGRGRVLLEETAIEFLLGLGGVPGRLLRVHGVRPVPSRRLTPGELTLRGECHRLANGGGAFAIDLVGSIIQGEQIAERAHAFGIAQHEKPMRFERVMKEGDDVLLQRSLQINQHIATSDQSIFEKGGSTSRLC